MLTVARCEMDYITISDVDAAIGLAWSASESTKARAIMMANAWLSATLPRDVISRTIPDAIRQAGIEIAQEAAAGRLYGAEGRAVESITTSAGDGVTVSKTYANGAVAHTAGERLALALLAPWLKRPTVAMLKRV